MDSAFDTAAKSYDSTFTNSVIGRLQRSYVYRQLLEILSEKNPKKILEINCGTGEDALWLASQNHNVIATDISQGMIAIAKSKGDFENLEFRQADINELSKHFKDEKFNWVFSNFGGLNCLSEIQLELFFKNTAGLLSEKGKLGLVIMPKNTLWEQLYFLSKGSFKNISRRKKGSLIANVDGESVITYYYNPKETIALADYYFKCEAVYPIGFFVPPSYLEPFFKNKKRFVSILDKLESTVQKRKSLSKYADHYLIIFEKR